MKKYAQGKQFPTVIVIEDNTLFLETILELLDANGFQAMGAQNGILGLQLTEALMPVVIICDISLPDFSGYEVLRKLRQNPSTEKIPLIFITEEPIDNAQYLIREMGANDYLIKPFSIEQLIQAIKAQIAGN